MHGAAVFFGVREALKPCATELENRWIGLAFIAEFGALLPLLLPITPISGAKARVSPEREASA
jgi:hypothetical protein